MVNVSLKWLFTEEFMKIFMGGLFWRVLRSGPLQRKAMLLQDATNVHNSLENTEFIKNTTNGVCNNFS